MALEKMPTIELDGPGAAPYKPRNKRTKRPGKMSPGGAFPKRPKMLGGGAIAPSPRHTITTAEARQNLLQQKRSQATPQGGKRNFYTDAAKQAKMASQYIARAARTK